NWRDIFQNWEALLFSHPGLAWHAIAKFLNASTVDGFNPYRFDRNGIDWERPSPEDPWGNYGYWGDHQAIYLCRLLEVAEAHFPGEARALLGRAVFAFADVPYRLKAYNDILASPKASLWFDEACDRASGARQVVLGSDGKLVIDQQGSIHLATLAEKLLLVVLGRLVNLVPGGGIWMNTQRPEWNDANNALAGQGLSVVTVAQLRRLVRVLQQTLCESSTAPWPVHGAVAQLLLDVTRALHDERWDEPAMSAVARASLTRALGEAGEAYRERAYAGQFGEVEEMCALTLQTFFARVLQVLDRTLQVNRRADGLYHSYNLLRMEGDNELHVDRLDLMLEGQVAVLGAEVLGPQEAAALLEALSNSELVCPEQGSYLLYPRRQVPGFLEKNRLDPVVVAASPLLRALLEVPDNGVVERGADGVVRFDCGLTAEAILQHKLALLASHPAVGPLVVDGGSQVLALYKQLLGHDRFLGRSMSMFAYEGIGSVYWHMVSKLLLAAWEAWVHAVCSGSTAEQCRTLKELAEDIGAGLGLRRSAASYGAFPTDPYSHTPMAGGARQPGMTGQVKENILIRRAELGVHVSDGCLQFIPEAIHPKEWLERPEALQATGLTVEQGSFGCLLYGIPVVWGRHQTEQGIRVTDEHGQHRWVSGTRLDRGTSQAVFERTGAVARLDIMI
ncbi:MAG: hypothetical protein MUF54_12675, partial [Polyangiaceae bacterium]|nr:hypothetical protein [Polyangiaceae bacterium]